MKLLSAGASPFVAKAAMAARFAGVDVESVAVDATNGDPALDAANPLSKIPCLVLDDGTGVYDSRTITRYLDRLSNWKLFPAEDPARLQVELMEAHCDGISDCAVAYMYEMRFRPEDKVHQPWLDRQWNKVNRGLDAMGANLPPVGDDAHMGTLALAAVLGYLDLRFAGKWEDGRGSLVEWNQRFDTAHPDLAALKPSA
ncbi:MAG: glutathione S-transferase N-terminal domain-containing protein [Pseudomonadota bacterium]